MDPFVQYLYQIASGMQQFVQPSIDLAGRAMALPEQMISQSAEDPLTMLLGQAGGPPMAQALATALAPFMAMPGEQASPPMNIDPGAPEGYMYHSLDIGRDYGNPQKLVDRMVNVQQQGLHGGWFYDQPGAFKPPWVAVKKTDLPPGGYKQFGDRATAEYVPQWWERNKYPISVHPSKVYLADEKGNLLTQVAKHRGGTKATQELRDIARVLGLIK